MVSEHKPDPTPNSPIHSLKETPTTELHNGTDADAEEADGPRTKESPLTDIATSPPPFDFLRDRSSRMGSSTGDLATDNQKSSKDSYESSELSDLADDDSEAETDKMDFLDENDDEQSSQPVSDLLALSKLTELARMKDVDSDFEDDTERVGGILSDKEDKERQSPLDPESNHQTPPKTEPETESTIESSKRGIEDSIEPEPKKHKKNESVTPEPATLDTNKNSAEDTETKNEDLDDSTNEVEKSDSNHDDEPKDVKPDLTNGNKIAHSDAEAAADAEEEDHEGEDQEREDEEEVEDDDNDDEPTAKAPAKKRGFSETNDEGEIEEEEEGDDEENNEEAQEDSDVDDQHLNEQRKLAIEELIAIEGLFAELRDKLYQDKLSLLERELQLCLEGSHPELSKIYYKVNGFYQESLKLANFNLAYNLKCIDKETIATRTSIHQDFLKNLMDTKNDMITETTSLWYKVNRERNQLDQLVPDYNFAAVPLIPNVTVAGPPEEAHNGTINGYEHVSEYQPLTKKTIKHNTLVELVQQHNNRNHQLGVLNGLVQFHGFPSAINTSLVATPEISSAELLLKRATDEEILEDLKDMGIPI
ncbi:uncharacterized protein CANTADRAFT_8545 [Suhomyces tanzawaensis NRRL Y-17324]|uniref:Transcriptional regulatory protein DEP1 n=1 Tax=Suhomyces tanzawaensis NRRL Y-17324 TaxID=984487 RepID=A0A1E4SAV0_9ASCO|nr:uncharacterized protein CANTADRAFT_8545 [Suhomyces tanzawaensis NRRL Y-17324]ODV76650.1 hypothetical protein CANTADRAFT_8545 [Suhomyces tanzawaensis NRRL Y-17324]